VSRDFSFLSHFLIILKSMLVSNRTTNFPSLRTSLRRRKRRKIHTWNIIVNEWDREEKKVHRIIKIVFLIIRIDFIAVNLRACAKCVSLPFIQFFYLDVNLLLFIHGLLLKHVAMSLVYSVRGLRAFFEDVKIKVETKTHEKNVKNNFFG
jgi:hypothetical protein